MVIESREAALRGMRAMAAKYADGDSIVDEWIAERRVIEVVLDRSAVLAHIFTETGANLVEGELPGALLCSVDLAEVVAKLHDREFDIGEAA